ncbi:MAG TPA: T9SS type A sorting domain-containing protein, partial [Cytophagaceae bacterium]
QVIKFNTSGAQVGTFGAVGGISAGTKGIVGDLRFWNISGAGTDANGNLFVALNENCVSLRKFNPAGVKQWEVLGTMFTDIGSIDPTSDGADIYTMNEHIKFDYVTQQWSLYSMTLDRINNPSDPRALAGGGEFTSALMRRVNGNRVMFMTSMYADFWDVYRFDGEIAIHSQRIKDLGWSSLPDKNGNIWYESNNELRKISLTGFSKEGNPVFGAAVVVAPSIPAPIKKVERIEYDAQNDVMFIAGWTDANPNVNNNWGLIGSTISRFPNWSGGNRTASHSAVMPNDVEGFPMKAMSVADGYLFVGGSRDRGKLNVFKSTDLSSVGVIAAPTDMGEPGWLDIPHAIQAFKRSNGQYVILVEDNSKGKNFVYQWCPSNNCTPITNITDIALDEQIYIYPNPVADNILISGSVSPLAKYEIISVDGKLVKEGNIKDNLILSDDVQKGLYLLKIKTESAAIIQRFLKE